MKNFNSVPEQSREIEKAFNEWWVDDPTEKNSEYIKNQCRDAFEEGFVFGFEKKHDDICKWKFDNEGGYNTSCNSWFQDGVSYYRYCPNCGHKVEYDAYNKRS